MKIKAIKKYGSDLPLTIRKLKRFSDDDEFNIQISKHYTVYAIAINKGLISYLIWDDNYSYFPRWYSSALFIIVDGKISKYWSCWQPEFSDQQEGNSIFFTFPEWVNNFEYNERLVDGEDKEVKIFQEYKQKMDLEFPDPEITYKAQALEEEWMMCPFCIDAWKPLSHDGMVICPICKRTMHNPYFKSSNELI